jgi:hypothetical protein
MRGTAGWNSCVLQTCHTSRLCQLISVATDILTGDQHPGPLLLPLSGCCPVGMILSSYTPTLLSMGSAWCLCRSGTSRASTCFLSGPFQTLTSPAMGQSMQRPARQVHHAHPHVTECNLLGYHPTHTLAYNTMLACHIEPVFMALQPGSNGCLDTYLPSTHAVQSGLGSRHGVFARGAAINIAADGSANICFGASSGLLHVLEVSIDDIPVVGNDSNRRPASSYCTASPMMLCSTPCLTPCAPACFSSTSHDHEGASSAATAACFMRLSSHFGILTYATACVCHAHLQVDEAGRFRGPSMFSHHTSPITAISSAYQARQGRWVWVKA